MKWFIYNLLFPIGFAFLLPKFLFRMIKRGGYTKHFLHRFAIFEGEILERLKKAPNKIWLHAVSVGEIQIALALINEWRKIDNDVVFVLSTTTSTAYALAKRALLNSDVLIYFPLDFPYVIRRALSIIAPKALLIIECELWPNLIRNAAKRKIPVFLINARISQHSFKGYKLLKCWVKDVLQCFSLIIAQNKRDKERLIALGANASCIQILPSLKYDVAAINTINTQLAKDILKKAKLPDNAMLLVGGSTWAGEEDILLKIYRELKVQHSNLFLILIPRHVERKKEVIETIKKYNFSLIERTVLNIANAQNTPDVLLVDTTGESRNFYAIADIIFIGKSLTAKGGQNIIEPAFFGKPILVGPYVENFAAIVADALAEEAIIQIKNESELKAAVANIINDAAKRDKLGISAKNFVMNRMGSIKKTVDYIMPYCKRSKTM